MRLIRAGWLAVRPPQLRTRDDGLQAIALSRVGLVSPGLELEEVPMAIVGGMDIHRKQITFDYLDTEPGEVRRGQIAPADRARVREWLARFAGRGDVAFAI